MKTMARVIRAVLRHLKDTRGVSLYEITAAVAMTGILAAVAVPVIIEKTTEAKVARVTQEVNNISDAINNFKRDTGKSPGQAEDIRLFLTGPFGFHALLPDGASLVFSVPGVTISDAAHTCTGKCGNINDYLVRDPNTTVTNGAINYPNWKGPYLDEVFIDQFDRSYVINVAPLYKQEQTGSTAAAGQTASNSCGFAWVLSGGPDRKLTTGFKATTFPQDANGNPISDDIGRNSGKLIGPGSGCTP